MKIGELRLIPKGTKVFSIILQENVVFDRDVVVKVDARIIGEKNFFFGKMQLILFNFPGAIPGIVDKAHGDLSLDIRNTKPYTL